MNVIKYGEDPSKSILTLLNDLGKLGFEADFSLHNGLEVIIKKKSHKNLIWRKNPGYYVF